MTTSRRRGLTLMETAVSLGVFSMLVVLLFFLLRDSTRAWNSVESRYDAQKALAQVEFWLKSDLQRADIAQIGEKRVSSAPGNGDVVWFLSAIDPTIADPDLQFQRDPATGSPNWQRHVIYYLVRPNDYSRISNGFSPAVDPNLNADYYAPHKVLIRKVVDLPASPETLMNTAQVDTYTTAPDGYDVSGFAATEPGLVETKIVATGLLSFEVEVLPNAAGTGGSVSIDTYAVRFREAEKVMAIGNTSLQSSPYTILQRSRIVPRG